jgi:hypothetical protein
MAFHRLHRLVTLILPLALTLGGASFAQAQSLQNSTDSDAAGNLFAPAASSGGPALDSVIIRGGGLIATFGSGLRLDVANGQQGTNISFENDLGFTHTHATYFFDGEWRIGGRHRLFASYVQVKRDATKAGISQPITIGNTTFQIGANVQAFIDTSYLSFDYGLALMNRRNAEIVATIGLSSVKVHTGAGLELQATTGGSVSRSLTSDAQDRVSYPVPGVQMNFRVHQHLAIVGYTRFIKATLEGVTESSLDGRYGADFPLSSHLGVGAGYYFNRTVQEGSREQFTGKLTYSFHGPQIYGMVQF